MKFIVLALALIGSSAYASDQACFYRDLNRSNLIFCAPAGQEAADLTRAGASGAISSIAVEGSTTVTLFSQPNFQGVQITIPGNNNDLRVLHWNDVAKSLRINRVPGRVCFYQDADWKGAEYCLVTGSALATLVPKGWNDIISSVMVVGDASGYFWENINYQGAVLVVRQSTPNLGNWNDKASSVKVPTAAGLP